MGYACALVGALAVWALAAATGLAQSVTGGTFAGPPPSVSDVVCRASCAGIRLARPGSTVRLRGSGLAAATAVVFEGARGARDDRRARPTATGETWVDVKAPRHVRPGPVVVRSADGRSSRPSRRPLRLAAPGASKRPGTPALTATPPTISVDVGTRRVYVGGARRAKLEYLVHGAATVTATVELLRTRDGAVVASWPAATVQPETPQTVVWDGTAGGERVEEEGRYQFRVTTDDGRGVVATSAQTGDGTPPGSFQLLRHVFPVRAKHHYGEFGATFGGGRGHQGHDVFAACGAPLVAARAGVVEVKKWHGAAGNYVVIDVDGAGVDHAYMHLRDPALVEVGDRVATGERIGAVGATGRASGCHLHFEIWSSPGWYTGGSPYDPLPELRAWDAQS